MTLYEIVATILSLIYVVLAIRNRPICFIFGAIASIAWGYVSFFQYHLAFDALLQIFYVLMSIYGIYQWRSAYEEIELPITRMQIRDHIITLLGSIGVGLLVAYITLQFYDIAWPYLDSVTTGMLIFATYWLTQRKLENWIYFIMADATYIYIYWQSGAEAFAGMMVLYTIMAVLGYWSWRGKWSVGTPT